MWKRLHSLHIQHWLCIYNKNNHRKMLLCSCNVHVCNISQLERKIRVPLSEIAFRPDDQSDTNAVGPRKVRHVGCQGRVGGQDFNWQIPAEGIHVHVLRPGPNRDLRLVLQHCGRLQRFPGSDEFKVQAPPQDHCTGRVEILLKLN